MNSGESELSGNGPGKQTTTDPGGCPAEAAKQSPDSSEPHAATRAAKRRVKSGVSSPGSSDSRLVSGDHGRVLRARGARGAVISKSKNEFSQRKPENIRRPRGRPTVTSRPGFKNTGAMDTMKKKSSSKKASLHTLGPKLSRSRKGQQRASTQDAPTCKTEPDVEVALHGAERCTLRGTSGNVSDEDLPIDVDPPSRDNLKDLISKPEANKDKLKRHATLRQKEDKKGKQSEKEKDKNEIKTEESTKTAVTVDDEMKDEIGDDAEPLRKRGRRRKDDKTPRLPKQRKKPPVQYVRCEIEGCGTILAHPRYLQHHIKYQHLLKKKYVCSHPSCGRLFRLQKQLLRHAKHHTDQRDFICEYCARAFKSSHNLAVHRMIHTGEKPIQCEICGFTCRQKASLNWHMKKHDADSFYQFSCSICGKKFEKKDCVVAHKAKSHPEVLIAEALAANGTTQTATPSSAVEVVAGLTSPSQPSISQEIQDTLSGTLTPLEQVVLPFPPQTQVEVSQAQLLQLAPHHVVQVKQEQETPTLLQLTTAPTSTSTVHLSSSSHPQLIQLTTLPVTTTTTPMAVPDCQSTLLTLSSVTSLASQQAVEWVRGPDGDAQLAGEGDLWERVIVGRDHQDVGEMVWQGDGGDRRKEDEGIVWDREGEREMLLENAEVHGNSLI